MLILSAMSDEELISYCSETLISIYSQHEIHKYPNTVLKFIVQIVKLEDLLNDAIKKQQSTIYSALYNLFIHIGETHSRLILDAILTKEEYRDSILKLITFVLQCSATDGYYPVDETCSEQAFNFWYTLQDDIIASEQDKVASYLALFNPLYQTLMDTLIKKVKYPPDQIYEQDWTNEDKESFRCYRQDIGDTFMYCYNMLRNSMLSILMNHFNIAVLQLSNNLSQLNNMHHLNQLSTADKPWQHLEAVIFAFTSISENIDATESIHINNLFESLAQIPLAQIAAPRLTASIMEMFGAYYEWIYNHPEFLPKVLSLLVLGLKSDHIAVVSATMALKDITRECQTLILPYANQLLIACEECLRPNSNLKPKEKSRLMCTIGQVLSITPIEVTMNYLNIILPPLLAGLTVEPAQQDNNLASLSSFSQKNNILHHISMLTMLFTTLDPELKQSDPEDGGNELVCRYKSKQLNGSNGNKFQTPHPTLPIFQEVLPRLIQIATKYINEESIIEAFSDCVKKALFNLLDHAKPLIMDILRVLHDAYSQSYQPSLLDVLKLIMILYWEDTDLKPILNHFYKQVCSQTVNYCCQDAKQKSSLIEYFFTNAHLIMKKIPAIYRENSNQDNQDLQSMFNLASNALVLAEKPTVRSASIFLNEFLQRSVNPDNHNLVIIVNGEGQHLVNRIFVVIGGCHDSSKFNVEFMADLLLSLNQHHFDNYCRWLTIVFTEQDNFPTDKISKQQKEQYTKLLIRERKSKRKLREILSGLTLALRGFNNTEFCSEFFPQF